MTKKAAAPAKVKFGTTIPADTLDRIREVAEAEGLTIEQVFVAALDYWFAAMDGAGPTFRPVNAEAHRRLELALNAKDPEITEAFNGVLGIAERILSTGRS